MTKLIYIGGYGHSGSTLLEYLMAGSPAVLACGEVVSCLREGAANPKQKTCSCGQPPSDCPVWKLFHMASAGSPSTHAGLLQSLMQGAGSQYSAIVDSSKTAWSCFGAPFRLRRAFGDTFTLVHLVRQPAGACWSVLRKKSRRAEREGRKPYNYALRCGATVTAWSLANLSCEAFGLAYPRQYIRIRYEDFAHAPEDVLRGLFERVLPGTAWTSVDASIRDNRHQVYGNSVKHYQLSVADVKEDLKWQAEMPPEYSRSISALSYPLRLRYGY